MMRTLFIVLAVAVAIPSSVAGQAPAAAGAQPPLQSSRYVDPAAGLSLDDAIALALRQEPAIRAARTEVDVAAGRRQQAGLRANPTASVEYRDEPGGTDQQTMFGAQLPLELFRRGARVAVAEREIDVARLEVADRERLLAANVRARYGAALVAIRELTVIEELVGAAAKQLELLTARAREGAAPPLERDLLDVEVRRLRADQRLQAGRVDAALVELKRVLGLVPDAALTLRDSLEARVIFESSAALPAAGDDAVRARPDVRAAEARIEAADAAVRQSESEGRVDVTLFGSYMRMDAGFMQRGFAPDGSLERVRGVFNYVTGGAMVMVPLFNRNQGAIAAARAERSGAEAVRNATMLQARAEAAAARIDDVSTREAVAQYREGIRLAARKNLDVVSETFALGRATVFDVLNEQRRYLEIELAYTDALRSAFQARTRLQLAAGDIR